MAVLNIYDLTGTQTGTVEVKDTVFGIEPNQAVLHEVLTAELAAARQGTAATKTRAMVRGGEENLSNKKELVEQDKVLSELHIW